MLMAAHVDVVPGPYPLVYFPANGVLRNFTDLSTEASVAYVVGMYGYSNTGASVLANNLIYTSGVSAAPLTISQGWYYIVVNVTAPAVTSVSVMFSIEFCPA